MTTSSSPGAYSSPSGSRIALSIRPKRSSSVPSNSSPTWSPAIRSSSPTWWPLPAEGQETASRKLRICFTREGQLRSCGANEDEEKALPQRQIQRAAGALDKASGLSGSRAMSAAAALGGRMC